MNVITIVISSVLDSVSRRIIKIKRMGKSDIQTAKQYSPSGIDSNPIAGMRALYSDTANKKERAIIGYLNLGQLADIGETRIYSSHADGSIKMYLWCKKDGTLLIGGDSDNAVRYSPLNTGLQNLVTALQQELVKIQTGIVAGGGSYTPGTLNLDVSSAKINEIKTL